METPSLNRMLMAAISEEAFVLEYLESCDLGDHTRHLLRVARRVWKGRPNWYCKSCLKPLKINLVGFRGAEACEYAVGPYKNVCSGGWVLHTTKDTRSQASCACGCHVFINPGAYARLLRGEEDIYVGPS